MNFSFTIDFTDEEMGSLEKTWVEYINDKKQTNKNKSAWNKAKITASTVCFEEVKTNNDINI